MDKRQFNNLKTNIGYVITCAICLSAVYLILDGYYTLYTEGYIQCTKSDLENYTFWKTTFGSSLLIVVAGRSLAGNKRLNEKLAPVQQKNGVIILLSFLAIVGMILVFMLLFKVQNFIENKIKENTLKQISLDGVKRTGIIGQCYTNSYGRRGSNQEYHYIDFKYAVGKDSVSSCYMFENGNETAYKEGDTIHCIVSKSSPLHYVLVE